MTIKRKELLNFLLNIENNIKNKQEFLMKKFLAIFQLSMQIFWAQKSDMSKKMTKIGHYTEKSIN